MAGRMAVAFVGLVLAGCMGSAPPPPPVALLESAAGDTIEPRDIGCQKLALRVEVAALHELETAVLVLRDGRLSREDSRVLRRASNRAWTHTLGILAFAPGGPLRPESPDHLVLVDGRRLTVPDTGKGALASRPTGLQAVGREWVMVACWVMPSSDRSTSAIDGNDCAFGVWIFVRQRPLAPDHELCAKRDDPTEFQQSGEGSLDEAVRILLRASAGASPPSAPAAATPVAPSGF